MSNPGPPWVHSDHVAAAVVTAYGDGLREGAENERQRIRQHPEVGTIGDGNGHVIRYLVPADLLDGDGDD